MSQWPHRPPPDDLVMPLWKFERWLAEANEEDRAYFAEVARHTLARVDDEVSQAARLELRRLAS